jgi:hypothetical protein
MYIQVTCASRSWWKRSSFSLASLSSAEFSQAPAQIGQPANKAMTSHMHGMHGMQGGQIGRIIAYWVIVYFGQFFENYRTSPKIWATFFHGKSY